MPSAATNYRFVVVPGKKGTKPWAVLDRVEHKVVARVSDRKEARLIASEYRAIEAADKAEEQRRARQATVSAGKGAVPPGSEASAPSAARRVRMTLDIILGVVLVACILILTFSDRGATL